AGHVVVGAHPLLPGKLAEADRVATGDGLPLLLRDLDERPAAPEHKRGVGGSSRRQPPLIEYAVRRAAAAIGRIQTGETRDVTRPPIGVVTLANPDAEATLRKLGRAHTV